jgi:hypothetical protein
VAGDGQDILVAIQPDHSRLRLRLMEQQGKCARPTAQVEYAKSRLDVGLADEGAFEARFLHPPAQERVI